MKRLIDWHLKHWKDAKKRKPLLLKGARQIGKTYSVRQLGKEFETFIEINFELIPEAKSIFEKDLQPERIVWELGLLTKQPIVPGKTLLFFDEVQAAPQAILSLRYFYELMPELHVAAAGSLVDFAVEKVGITVGRVSMLYVYPLSFLEFLAATGNGHYIEPILEKKALSLVLHETLLDLVGQYLAIGGMPEAVQAFVESRDPRASYEVHQELAETYRQDFPRYAKRHLLTPLDLLFNQIPHVLGKQFKYSEVHGDYQKRELAPCIDLLRRANVIHQITHTAANGLPLGAEVNLNWFKLIFLDVGMTQHLLGLDLASWFLNPDRDLVNRGAIVEAFVGQELLAYASPKAKQELYFWKRDAKGAQSEVDFVYDHEQEILPIEVKSGHGSTLRSLHQFLQAHQSCKGGIRFWSGMEISSEKLLSRPLYAVATLADADHSKALRSLV